MRILLVEDEHGLAEALQTSLQRERYSVDWADNGEDGLELALSGIYDIILLDVMLPKMNGYQIVQKIRQKKMNVPVLMLTAKAELDDKVKGLDSGADDYLTKPFQTKELLARIRALTRRRGTVEENTSMTYADLDLDMKKCEISCTTTGKTMKLSAKEYQLLEYFLRNRGQIISREQIVEKIWGFDADAEYNNAEVYISFVRKKINFIGADVKIKAVRGIGYTLDSDRASAADGGDSQ